MSANGMVRPCSLYTSSNTATPDFNVDAGDGTVVVEVFTKHQHAVQTELLCAIAAGKTPEGVERSVVKTRGATLRSTIATLQPGGAPDPSKPHGSVQANLISRVCAAKGDETQLPDGGPSLLWMDFRSFGLWPEALRPEQAAPLLSGRDGLTSGALWYAFYGWRGAPIFEEDYPHDRVVPMGHDGRFRIIGEKKSKLSGAILALPDGLVLLENPWAVHSLPDRARRLCERLPWFDLGRSMCNWSTDDALSLADLGRRQIEVVAHWRAALIPD